MQQVRPRKSPKNAMCPHPKIFTTDLTEDVHSFQWNKKV
ncbi:hypothetical protein SJ05684_c21220 [Sinorhizobium sojae CCBAU 05684]|uniref:Uncharacterized protein n=1 Tax=Sinorhizobium sojae CCBAU 05684 TaxID=716928 RepID=A0A249PCA7_9HYPH|nr:hypothetical protein SJ05684_c21220 [Sinorhizobium sojae CCBAU 05684]